MVTGGEIEKAADLLCDQNGVNAKSRNFHTQNQVESKIKVFEIRSTNFKKAFRFPPFENMMLKCSGNECEFWCNISSLVLVRHLRGYPQCLG